ncbi:MAG: ATP-dependent protease subunit HslV [Firmicutes bacterium]|jgi:ATP-dependent HslUV protease subunit HslV|nr:ATP-dependent protease subunit HslV [Bacillota bacterium]HQD39470.1 ATP-dependent protease subunit HslV [Bacillota bacterium]
MDIKSTTVLAVRRDGKLAMAADGQVTLGQQMIKQKARKVRRLYQDQVIVGFAGAAADAFALLDKFEGYLEQYSGNLMRAAVALAQQWRTDRALRRLEALLIAANEERMLLLSGTGDIIEPDEDILAIGSGGSIAYAAAKALYENTELSAEAIARKALEIAGSVCIYTNDQITMEKLPKE